MLLLRARGRGSIELVADDAPAVLLIDDLRSFRDASVPALVARTSDDGLRALQLAHALGRPWVQVWLDHDLGETPAGPDDVMRIIDWLCEQSATGAPVAVETILVHTSNRVGGDTVVRTLSRAGYRTVRVAASDYLHA